MSMGRGGIFGNPDWTPKRGGMFGIPQENNPFGDMVQLQGIQGPRASEALPDRKPGFRLSNTAANILGALGDSLAMYGGLPPIYAQTQQRKQQELAQIAEEQRKRSMNREDFLFQQEWKRNNPEPVNNDTVNDFNWFKSLSPADQQLYARLKQGDPLVNITLPNGQFYSGPQSGLGSVLGANQQAAQAPKAPVGKLTPIGGSQGGSAPFAVNPPARLQGGVMTSGRRTVEGNRAVGGVPNSKHLTGEAVDYSGPDLNALLAEARKLPGLRRAFIHNGNHVHTEGNWNAPYFGKNGTRGK